MQYLARHLPNARLVSHDDTFVAPEDRGLIKCLKSEFLSRLNSDDCSPRFKLSLLASIIEYLSLRAAGSGAPVVIDGYYYKLLSKCVLHGLHDEKLFDAWRELPAPREVIFLDVGPELAWARCQESRAPNAFEHYTRAASADTFCTFQRDLRQRLLAEVGHVPLRMIDASRRAQDVMEEVQDTIMRGLDD